MATKFFAQGVGSFYIYKIAMAESGFNYYGRVHPTGRVLMVREAEDGSELLYADGGFDFDTSWTNRDSLDYKRIDLL
mgnify:CR=1 FL=1